MAQTLGLLCRVVLLCSVLYPCSGKVTSKTIKAGEYFTYLDKFVFDVTSRGTVGPPSVRYYAEGGTEGAGLVLYSDEGFSFPAAWDLVNNDAAWENGTETCRVLSAPCVSCHHAQTPCMMKRCSGPQPLVPMRQSDGLMHGTRELPYEDNPRQGTRPRFWYVAVVDCMQKGQGKLTIHLEFLNPGGWWRRQFSVDRQGILELLSLLAPAMLIFTTVFAYCVFREKIAQGEAGYVHIVHKWYLAVIAIQTIGLVGAWASYIHYASHGTDNAMYFEPFNLFANLLFMFFILAYATDFQVVGTRLSTELIDALKHLRKAFTVLFSVLLALHLLLYLWEMYEMSGPTTDNPYQTWPGILLACTRLPVFLFFLYNMYKFSAVVTTEKRVERLRWGLFFSAYILSLPLILMAAYLFSPHVKFRAVHCTQHVIVAFATVVTSWLIWPGAKATRTLAQTYTVAARGPDHMPFNEDHESDSENESSRKEESGGFGGAPANAHESSSLMVGQAQEIDVEMELAS